MASNNFVLCASRITKLLRGSTGALVATTFRIDASPRGLFFERENFDVRGLQYVRQI